MSESIGVAVAAEPTTTEKKPWTCSRCSVVELSKRLPRGWKDYSGSVCEACLTASYTMRAVTLPVARIVGVIERRGDTPTEVEGYLRHFHAAWRLSTDLANWAMRELVRRDVRREPGMTTLPKYDPAQMFGTFPRTQKRKGTVEGTPQVGTLYSTWNAVMPEEWRADWEGAAGTAGTILKAVEDTWKGHERFGRFAVLWRNEARPMVFRYPYPYPVRKGDWWAWWEPDDGGKKPYLSIPLPGRRIVLELARNPELKDQLEDFEALVTGAAHGGDLKIVPVERGGRIVGVKVAIAGRFPRKEKERDTEKTATIRTGPDSLLSVDIPRREVFVLYAPHLKGVMRALTTWEMRRGLVLDPTKPQGGAVHAKADMQDFKRRQKILAALELLRRELGTEGVTAPPIPTGPAPGGSGAGGPIDQLRREMAEYEMWLHRYRTDLKYEKRWPAQKRKRWVAKSQARIARHQGRVNSELKQACQAVIGFCVRQGCGVVEYDDTNRAYLPSWPWAAMRDRLKVLCAQENIEFRVIGTVTEEETNTEGQ